MPCRLAIPLTDLSIISNSYAFVKSKKQFFRLFFPASLQRGYPQADGGTTAGGGRRGRAAAHVASEGLWRQPKDDLEKDNVVPFSRRTKTVASRGLLPSRFSETPPSRREAIPHVTKVKI